MVSPFIIHCKKLPIFLVGSSNSFDNSTVNSFGSYLFQEIMDRSSHIVQGEASESDEEIDFTRKDDASKEFLAKDAGTKSKRDGSDTRRQPKQSAVISGEASESDEEIDTSDLGTKLQIDNSVPPNFKPQSSGAKDQSRSHRSTVKIKPKYDTVLHWKLVERNSAFRRNLCEAIGQVYLTSAKEIKTSTAHSTRSQLAVQDISHTMRLLTNDLFHLEDKLDMIADSKLLPTVKIDIQ